MILTKSILNALGVRPLYSVDTVIIHHTVAPKTDDISTLAQMEEVSQNFITIGYHAYAKCIDPDKDIWVMQQGRPIWAVPAAAYGMNVDSYDISIGGNYQPGGASFLDTPSDHALRVVAAQILLAKKKLPNLKYLMGHRDVATIKQKQGLDPADYSTACPGDLLYAKLHDLRVMTGLHTRPELL